MRWVLLAVLLTSCVGANPEWIPECSRDPFSSVCTGLPGWRPDMTASVIDPSADLGASDFAGTVATIGSDLRQPCGLHALWRCCDDAWCAAPFRCYAETNACVP